MNIKFKLEWYNKECEQKFEFKEKNNKSEIVALFRKNIANCLFWLIEK